MNLYKVLTRGVGWYYVVAEHPTDAQDELIRLLNLADYGFVKDREVVKIEVLANLVVEDSDGRISFNKNNLVIKRRSKNVPIF